MTFFKTYYLSFLFTLLLTNVNALPPNFSPGPVISPVKTSTLANETILRTGHNQSIPQDVYIHVITADNNTSDLSFLIQTDTIHMNESSETYGLSFNIINTSYITNKDWFTAAPNSTEQKSMKKALRRGGYSDLNLYFVNSSAAVTGQACTPPSRNPTDQEKELDGCTLGYYQQNLIDIPAFQLPENETSLISRTRPVISFAPSKGNEDITPLAPELGRWYSMDINFAENCFNAKDDPSSLCVYKQANEVQKGPIADGYGPLLRPSIASKCLNETSPILCLDATKMPADVEARMEYAVLYGIGASRGNTTGSGMTL